nr:hypothetical protein [uncultured Sellimonas sp.]
MSPAQHVSQQTQHTKTKERIYVTVSSVFDATGYMQPTAITWADGRTFPIESVRDYHPASVSSRGDCYTVVIHGQEKHLFFERTDPLFSSRVGRWFVERTPSV